MKVWNIHGMVAYYDRPGSPPGNRAANAIEGEVIPFGTILPVVEKSLYDACVKSHDDNVLLLKEFQKLLAQAKNEIERLQSSGLGMKERVRALGERDLRLELIGRALETAMTGLKLMNKGPERTMAEPWSVWYEEHSGKCLAKIEELLRGEEL